MTAPQPAPADDRHHLVHRALRLEWITTAWNSLEVFVTIALGVASGSLALVAFGLDSLVEVFASLVVIWNLRQEHAARPDRTRLALRLLAGAFVVLSVYLTVASVRSLVAAHHPDESPVGIAFLAATAVVMLVLASRKRTVAALMGSLSLETEAGMTQLDAYLCLGILVALVANLALDWWWADPLAALAVAVLAAREGYESWQEAADLPDDLPGAPAPAPDA